MKMSMKMALAVLAMGLLFAANGTVAADTSVVTTETTTVTTTERTTKLIPKEGPFKIVPAGHPDTQGTKGLNCSFDEGEGAYQCPHDSAARNK